MHHHHHKTTHNIFKPIEHHHTSSHNIFKPIEHHHITSSHNIFKPIEHHQSPPLQIRNPFFKPHPIELKPITIHQTHDNITHHNSIHHNNQQPAKPTTTIFSKGEQVAATVDKILTPDNSYLLFIGCGVLVALYLTTNK